MSLAGLMVGRSWVSRFCAIRSDADANQQNNSQTVVFIGNDSSVNSLIDFEIIEDKPSGKRACHVKKLVFDPNFVSNAPSSNDLVGSPLLRWATTYARHCCCSKIMLSCKTKDIASYERLDFKESSISPYPQEYTMVEKTILYNVPFRLDPINE
jgi:hypothetical protein